MTSLYVHIPFCLKRCIYCDFVSGIYDPRKADAYIDALDKEVLNIPEKTQISTLFIGGGTPTALSVHALSNMIRNVFSRFSFIGDYEATIEANPGTVDKDKFQAIRSSGINRVSIGIQSFDDDELSLLGRIHSSDEAEQAVRLARDAGFKNIGTDLIYGIPGQDILSWRKTLEKAVRLKPEHISTYELTVEKGTLLYEYLMFRPQSPPSPRGRGTGGGGNKFTMPDEDKIIEMYEHTIDYLTAEGYSHYEISNFSLPGYECKHNLNYWDRGEYYGIGLGAHSFMYGKRFHNTDNLEDYLKTISEGKSTVKETELITEEKALSEAIFLGLRKTGGINLESFSKRYRVNVLGRFEKEIKEFQEAGLLEITESECSYETTLRFTRKGLLLSNEVFARFI
ncbi:MAG: radical SAM family heme chaperone HemW [Nitrospiraceae bacterium]|nr:MAG: radical SAM family heme chaperone HemW [Nitrospiraceae bacterium]